MNKIIMLYANTVPWGSLIKTILIIFTAVILEFVVVLFIVELLRNKTILKFHSKKEETPELEEAYSYMIDVGDSKEKKINLAVIHNENGKKENKSIEYPLKENTRYVKVTFKKQKQDKKK